MPTRPSDVTLDPAEQRKLAVDLFNYTWTLLEREERSSDEDERMIHAAHASRFFWDSIGEPVHHARGEWQLSRVYATVRRGEPALHHAGRCLSICEENGIADFDLAYAHEALSRAYALLDEADLAAQHHAVAELAAEDIADTDDRDLLLSDLATLPV